MKHFSTLPGLAVLCLLYLLASASPIALAQDAELVAQKAPAEPAEAKEPKLELDLDEKVLVFTKPLREDGTIDYIAALNNKYSEGVTNENNAFRALYLLLPVDDEWEDQADYHAAMREVLKITDAEIEQAPRFVAWLDFAAQRGHDHDAANEIEDGFKDDVFNEKIHPDYLAWLEANESVFVAAGEAVALPRYWAPMIEGDGTGMLIAVLLPQLGNHRMLARGLQDRAFHAAATGDEAKVLDSLQTVSRLALHQSQGTFLISGLVAISIDAINADTIKRLLAERKLSGKSLVAIDKIVRDRAERVRIAQTVMEGERCFGLDAYMQIMAGRVSPDGLIGGGGDNAMKRLFGSGAFDVNRGLRQFSRYYYQLVKIMAIENYARRQRVSEIFEQNFDELLAQKGLFIELGEVKLPNPALMTKDARTDAMTRLMMAILFPALGAAANAETRFLATEHCMLAAIACERYRLKHGELPVKLTDLVPAYLDAVPIDPFNDEPVRYKQTDNGFVVYSVGQNLQDNGGVENREDRDQSDWVFDIVWDMD